MLFPLVTAGNPYTSYGSLGLHLGPSKESFCPPIVAVLVLQHQPRPRLRFAKV